jgi:hypothetical protein
LLRDITVARIFWLSQSEERKNSAKPKRWPSMIRNVSLVNGQTDRLALPYWARGFCRFVRLQSSHFRYEMVDLLLPAGKGEQPQGPIRSCSKNVKF